ncbi:MAG: LamG-like jellyroll fold domain-containing protein [Candidatus Paceibacterota bacterium]|jgi:hypothetical protein
MQRIKISHGIAILGACFFVALLFISSASKQIDLIALPVSPSSQTAAVSDFDSNLIVHWTFDEGSGTTAGDSAGSNAGTLINSPAWVAGKIGQAISLDVSQNSSVNTAISFTPPSTGFSISLWMKTSMTGGSPTILGWGNRFLRLGAVTANKVSFIVDGTSAGSATSVCTINDGQWHHIVITSTASSQTLYCDTVAGVSTSETLDTVANKLAFGKATIADSDKYTGLFDDIRVYNRALTLGEITELYNYTGGTVTLPNTYSLTVTNGGNGTVNSNPTGISCGGTCSISGITTGTAYALTATPNSNYTTSWSGCTFSSGNTCNVTVNSNTTVTATFEPPINGSGLLLHLTMNNTYADSSSPTKPTTWTSPKYVPGPYTSQDPNDVAASMEGGYMTVGASPVFTGMNQLTYSMWVKKYTTTSYEWMLEIADSYYLLLNDQGYVKVGVFSSVPVINGSYYYSDIISYYQGINTNWNLYTVTYDGTKYTLYIDGTAVATHVCGAGTYCAGSVQSSPTNPNILAGRRPNQYFNGAIDDVRVYNRVLSPTEISALYVSQGAPPPASQTYSLSIAKSGTGAGTVSGGTINCGSTCTQSNISAGTTVTLIAAVSPGSIFGGWSGGGCSGSTSTCTVSVTANTTVTATFTSSTPPPPSIAPGKVLHLDFSSFNPSTGVASDSSGLGNNGRCNFSYVYQGSTVNQCPTTATGPNGTTNAVGFFGTYPDLNDAGDYISVAKSSSINNLITGAISLWVKSASTDQYFTLIDGLDSVGPIFGSTDYGLPGTWALQRGWSATNNTYTTQFISFNDASATFNGQQVGTRQTVIDFNDKIVYTNATKGQSNWNNYAVTWDGTNIRGYLNGVLIATTPQTNLSSFNIGKYLAVGSSGHYATAETPGGCSEPCGPYPNHAFINGYMADVRIYNTSLTSQDITNVYNEGLGMATPPPQPSGGVWYVDNAVASSGNGGSWGTAWKNLSNINWTSVKAGDTIFISGGLSSKTYNEPLILTSKNGSVGQPITIRPGSASPSPGGHGGQVVITNTSSGNSSGYGILIYRSYIVVDGNSRFDDSGTPNIRVTGSYGSGVNLSGDNSRVSYLEIDRNGLLAKSGASTDGITFEGINSTGAREIDHNIIHDNWQDGIHGYTTNKFEGFGLMKIHDNEIYNVADDGMEVGGNGIDVYNNIVHKMWYFGPGDARNRGAGHPDPFVVQPSGGVPGSGIKGGYARVWSNYFYDFGEYDRTSQGFYMNPLPEVNDANLCCIRMINNVGSGYTNASAQTGSLGITFSPQAPSGGSWASISDVVIANNTMVGFTGSGSGLHLYASAGQGGQSDGNNPIPYDPTISNFYVLNNIFYDNSMTNSTGIGFGRDLNPKWGITGWGGSTNNNVVFDNNIYAPGPAGASTKVQVNMKDMGTFNVEFTMPYATFKSQNSANVFLPQRYTTDMSETQNPQLSANLAPTSNSTNVINKGRNLSSLPNLNLSGSDSFILKDRSGITRGSSWDIGAYEYSGGSTQTPENGLCSTTLNQCTTGTFSDITDTSTNYLWSCLGSNGGTTASCSISISSIPADTTAPSITGINASNLTTTSATISWSNNEPTTTIIQYGATVGYGNSSASTSSGTMTLISLTPNSIYHYRIISTDAAGNPTTSGDGTFSTLPTPPSNDLDNDGVLNINDKCGSTPLGVTVNTLGCPLPKLTHFTIKPTLSGDLNSSSFDLGTAYGKVSFTNAPLIKSNGDALDIDSHLTIGQALVTLNSTSLPELNRPATITLYNLSFNTVKILKDGVLCTTCGTPSYSTVAGQGKTLVFTVSGFSTYTVIEGTDPTPSTHTVTVNKSGSGSGTVTATGINCGTDCSHTTGSAITLTATPSSGSTFTGWSGGYCSGVNSCSFVPTQDSTVIATFTVIPSVTQPSPGGGGGNVNNPPSDTLGGNSPLNTIAGCDNGTVGFSKTTGQSCALNSSSSGTYNFGNVTLKEGSVGEAVKELQRFLNATMNLGLVVDGKLGVQTIIVIKKWQLDHGLVPDGLIGAKTKAMMNASVSKTPIVVAPPTTPSTIPGCGNRTSGFSSTTGVSCIGNVPTSASNYNLGTVTLRLWSRGEAVKELQRFLNDKLNLGLVLDGILGPKTIAVIKKWQTDHNLVSDGLVGPKTKAMMNAQ